MKKGVLLVSVLFFLISCKYSNNNSLINNPQSAYGKKKWDKIAAIKFVQTSRDFGTITEGEKVSFSFKFYNTGKNDLIIEGVVPGCGCTSPSWPKEPIKPGDYDFISLEFNSNSYHEGVFSKSAKVYTNTVPPMNEIFISGKVKKK